MSTLTSELRDRGVIVFPGVVPEDEIARLRDAASAHFAAAPHRRSNLGRNQPNFVRFAPTLAPIVHHPAVLASLRRVLGDRIVFTGQSDLAIGRLSGWHKDSDHLGPPQRVAAARDFAVVKAALYLEDQRDEHEAFHYRLGSHRAVSMEEGEPRSIPTRAGDLILFDVRLTHAGRFADFNERWLHRAARPFGAGPGGEREVVVRLREWYWKVRGRRSRTGLFFTYGAPGGWTDAFARVNQARQARYNAALGLPSTPGVTAAFANELARHGVLLAGRSRERAASS